MHCGPGQDPRPPGMEVVFCQLGRKNGALREPPQIPVGCAALTELGLHASHVPRGFQPEALSRGTARLNTSQREAHLGCLSPHAWHSGGTDAVPGQVSLQDKDTVTLAVPTEPWVAWKEV